jgi:hypothetical protein
LCRTETGRLAGAAIDRHRTEAHQLNTGKSKAKEAG